MGDKLPETETSPIPMLLWCPGCHERHIDTGEFATKLHHTHACQHCGMVWRPAIEPTVGVQFLPGFAPEALEGRNKDWEIRALNNIQAVREKDELQ